MNEKYKNKYRVSSARLPCWDYGSHALYYITICTKDRLHYFGEIISEKVEMQDFASLRRTPIGDVAYNNWLEIPSHFPFVELDEFVLMPNHIHGVLFINKPDKVGWDLNKFGAQSRNLASIIRGYKASVKKYATLNDIDFGWQPRYYDRVIRDEREYSNVSSYIFNNPEQWLLKGDNEDNLFTR